MYMCVWGKCRPRRVTCHVYVCHDSVLGESDLSCICVLGV